jgi:hypothetical protein
LSHKASIASSFSASVIWSIGITAMSRIYLKEMNWQRCFYPGKSSSTTDEPGCADGLTRPNLGKNGNASYIQASGLCRKSLCPIPKFLCKPPAHFGCNGTLYLLAAGCRPDWHAGKRAATSWRQPSWLPVNAASSRVFPRQIQCPTAPLISQFLFSISTFPISAFYFLFSISAFCFSLVSVLSGPGRSPRKHHRGFS